MSPMCLLEYPAIGTQRVPDALPPAFTGRCIRYWGSVEALLRRGSARNREECLAGAVTPAVPPASPPLQPTATTKPTAPADPAANPACKALCRLHTGGGHTAAG
jgi:hypothetical protein